MAIIDPSNLNDIRMTSHLDPMVEEAAYRMQLVGFLGVPTDTVVVQVKLDYDIPEGEGEGAVTMTLSTEDSTYTVEFNPWDYPGLKEFLQTL